MTDQQDGLSGVLREDHAHHTGDIPVGLVTLEDLLEALLGMEITDEAAAVESLRPAVARSRRQRTRELGRRRVRALPPAD